MVPKKLVNYDSEPPRECESGSGAPGTLKFFTIAEVAEHLNVSKRTVQRWIDLGQLHTHYFGRLVRIAENDLIDFLNKHRDPDGSALSLN